MKISGMSKSPAFVIESGSRMAWFARDTRGATASIFAIVLPAIIGFGALAIDVGIWSMKSRQAQGAADQAAYSAAVANSLDGDPVTEARAITAAMGMTHGVDGVTVEVTNPPQTGAYAGSTRHWQVTVRQPQNLGLAALFVATVPTVVARAVAGNGGGGSCVIGLAQTETAVTFINNSQLQQAECDVYSNSGITIGNSNNILIDASLYSAGSVDQGQNAIVTGDQFPISTFDDPYRNIVVPSRPATCIPQVKDGANLQAGWYCDGFNLGNSAKDKVINLGPGVYHISKQFKVGQNFTFKGEGVTLIFDVPDPSKDVAIGNGNIFDILAPTAGPLSGIAFMSNTAANPSTFEFGNNNILSVQGAFYFPNSTLIMNNNLDSSRCTQLVAFRIELSNNATMKANCPGAGIKDFGGTSIALVE